MSKKGGSNINVSLPHAAGTHTRWCDCTQAYAAHFQKYALEPQLARTVPFHSLAAGSKTPIFQKEQNPDGLKGAPNAHVRQFPHQNSR